MTLTIHPQAATYDPTLVCAGSSSESCLLAVQEELEQAAEDARGLESRRRQTERNAAEGRIDAMADAARARFRGAMIAATASVAGSAGDLLGIGSVDRAAGAACPPGSGDVGSSAGSAARGHVGRSLGALPSLGDVVKSVFDHRAATAEVRRERAHLEEQTASDERKDARSAAERAEQRASRQRELAAQLARERAETMRGLIRP